VGWGVLVSPNPFFSRVGRLNITSLPPPLSIVHRLPFIHSSHHPQYPRVHPPVRSRLRINTSNVRASTPSFTTPQCVAVFESQLCAQQHRVGRADAWLSRPCPRGCYHFFISNREEDLLPDESPDFVANWATLILANPPTSPFIYMPCAARRSCLIYICWAHTEGVMKNGCPRRTRSRDDTGVHTLA
jgi:hypothetical protein